MNIGDSRKFQPNNPSVLVAGRSAAIHRLFIFAEPYRFLWSRGAC